MKRIGLLTLLVLASCGKYEEEYLYTKYSKEYQALQAMQAEECKNDSPIFEEFDKRGNFRKYYDEGTIFKVNVKKADGGEATDFIKLTNVSTNNLTIQYFGEYGNHKRIEFTSQQNKALLAGLSNGACDHRDDFKYKSSSLDSKTSSTFTDRREQGKDDEKETEVEVFTADTSAPLALMYWNRTERNSRNSKQTSYKLTKIGKQAQCDNTDICKQATWTGYPEHFFRIDPGAHNSNALSSRLIDIEEFAQESLF